MREQSVMTTSLSLTVLLKQLTEQLQHHGHWQTATPSLSALASTEPFAIDTLSSTEWLQWIFIPKMFILIENGHPLPKEFSIAPYIEEALKNQKGTTEIIGICQNIDKLGKIL